MKVHRCGMCGGTYQHPRDPRDYHFPCPTCIARMEGHSAAVNERARRVASGDLSMCEDATPEELDQILRARREARRAVIS